MAEGIGGPARSRGGLQTLCTILHYILNAVEREFPHPVHHLGCFFLYAYIPTSQHLSKWITCSRYDHSSTHVSGTTD